jgi:hypothetical protein
MYLSHPGDLKQLAFVRAQCLDQSDEDPALCGADSQCGNRQVKCPGGVGCLYFEGICNGMFE